VTSTIVTHNADQSECYVFQNVLGKIHIYLHL